MEEGGETILVRAMKTGGYGYDEEKRRGYVWAEFHKVDLKQEGGTKVERNCYPELRIWSGVGKMVRAGPKLYVIGGLAEDEDVECASVLDLETKEEWKHIPLPIKDRSFPRYESLDGKIYHYAHSSHYASECNDPNFGRDVSDFFEFMWTPPPPAAGGGVLGGVVPDPDNNRLLVNLDPGHLYAYYPTIKKMEHVGDGVYPWSKIVAVVDNIAYVHEPEASEFQSLFAFDLSKGKPLDVVWTSTVFQETIDGVSHDVDVALFEFDALIHVGNNNFWFARWNADHRGDDTRIFFIKFKAVRLSQEDKIICTPFALRAPLLDSTSSVSDFLLLQ